MESSNPGLSFAAQPAALTMAVSFTVGVKPHLTMLRFDYNDVPQFVLAHNGVGARVPISGKIALERIPTARGTEPNWRPRAMRLSCRWVSVSAEQK